MSRSVLITGGAGFIGANFARHWSHTHPRDAVIVLDALTYAGNRASIEDLIASGAVRFVHGDIRDGALVASLLRDARVDTIVHLAAESHVDRSILGPDAFIETNIVGTHRMLGAARQVWLAENSVPGERRFHHVSTDEVYGSLEPDDPPFTERTPYAPNSPYAASKAASDHLVRAYHRTFGLPVTMSNCSNNYGPCQFPEKLLPLAIVNCLDGRPVPIYGDGMQVRDWLHVADHCKAIAAVIERGRDGESYNFGGGTTITNLELLRRLCRIMDRAFTADPALASRFPSSPAARGAPCEQALSFVRDRPGHDRRYAIDGTRAREELGFTAETTLDAGLERLVAWYLANEPWWRAVQDGSYRDWIERQYGAARSAGG